MNFTNAIHEVDKTAVSLCEEDSCIDAILEIAERYRTAPRDTEEMKVWLFDLAHGNLKDDEILSGFIQHYILRGLTVDQVISDIVYHTPYGIPGVRTAKASLLYVLMNAAKEVIF